MCKNNERQGGVSVAQAAEVEQKIKQAMELAVNKQYTGAVAMLSDIDPGTPLAPEIHYNLGLLYGRCLIEDLSTNEYWEDHTNEEILFESAVTHYLKAVDIAPEMFEAYNNLARLCAVMGHVNEARDYYNLSLSINSEQGDVIEDLATLGEK